MKKIIVFLLLFGFGSANAYTPADTTRYADAESTFYSIVSDVQNFSTVWPSPDVQRMWNLAQDQLMTIIKAPEMIDTLSTTADSASYPLDAAMAFIDHVTYQDPAVSKTVGISEASGWMKGHKNIKETEPPHMWWQWGNTIYLEPYGKAVTLYLYGVEKPTEIVDDTTVISFERIYIPLLTWMVVDMATFSSRDPQWQAINAKAVQMMGILGAALAKKTDPELIPVSVGGQ